MFKRFIFRVAFSFVLLIAAALPSLAQTATTQSFTPQQRDDIITILRDAMKRDPSILRDAVVSMQAEDARQQSEQQASLLGVMGASLAGDPADPSTGNPNGKITLVEFYDVRCPYCRRMLPTVAALLRANKDVRVVYKDLPVLGPASVLGARALLAAQKQGGYLKLHEALMNGPQNVTDDSLHSMASKLGLNWERMQADMKAPDVLARIDANLAMAHKLDIQGTPAYVIGSTLLPGAVELTDLQAAVNTARQQAGG